MKRFLNLADSRDEKVAELVARARELRDGAESHAARDRTLGLLFFNPSLRTRVSMVAAWARLGGHAIELTPGQGVWGFATEDEPMLGAEAEHVEEAAGVLGRLCDVLGVRAFGPGLDWAQDREDPLLRTFAQLTACPLVNLESSLYHPCQAIGDRVTLEDHRIPRDGHFVLCWAYHPKALPMAVSNSAVLMACQRGMKVTILRPDGYELDEDVMGRARDLAQMQGGSLEETEDTSVLKTAHVVYAKSWGSLRFYGNAEEERGLRSRHRHWCVGTGNLAVQETTNLMHCLPVRRDVVVSTELLRAPNSLILDQAENRKWGQTAVLEQMICTRS